MHLLNSLKTSTSFILSPSFKELSLKKYKNNSLKKKLSLKKIRKITKKKELRVQKKQQEKLMIIKGKN